MQEVGNGGEVKPLSGRKKNMVSPCFSYKLQCVKRQNLPGSVCRWPSRWMLCRGICIPGRNFPSQLPERTTSVNNAQLIAERGTSQRPELTLQMQMNAPAASSTRYNKCLTVYGSWKRAPRSKSTPFTEQM